MTFAAFGRFSVPNCTFSAFKGLRSLFRVLLIIIFIGTFFLIFSPLDARGQGSSPASHILRLPESGQRTDFPRMPGEFERQRVLVVSVSDWQPHHANVFVQLVEKTRGHVDLLVLYNTPRQLELVHSWIRGIANSCDHLSFCLLELNTIWLRDFCPHLAEGPDGRTIAIDFYYEGTRPWDEQMPGEWARRSGAEHLQIPFIVQGGNWLCNGRGTVICTERIFEEAAIRILNPLPGTDSRLEGRKILAEALLKDCNLEQLVVLDYLQSEATRHVDMFACFVAEDQIVVSRLDPKRDPVNAAILDRNARRLEAVRIGEKPLRVHRIDVPPRIGNSWSAFTNIIIANDLILMPVFDTDPPDMVTAGIATYQRLRPECTIKTVDITTFKQLQGELHCLSMNVPVWGAMPDGIISWQQVLDEMQKKGASTGR